MTTLRFQSVGLAFILDKFAGWTLASDGLIVVLVVVCSETDSCIIDVVLAEDCSEVIVSVSEIMLAFRSLKIFLYFYLPTCIESINTAYQTHLIC